MHKSQTPLTAFLMATLYAASAVAAERPNIVLVFADDISARELPIYGSSVWSPPLRGDVMKAFLDDELVISLKSPGFAHPTKTKFGFTVNGQSIDFDNLVVRKLETTDAHE